MRPVAVEQHAPLDLMRGVQERSHLRQGRVREAGDVGAVPADPCARHQHVGRPSASIAKTLSKPRASRIASHEIEGCVLLDRERAHELIPDVLKTLYASATDGHGPLAWRGHWLVVSLQDRDGATIGAIWVDDPSDHLLPTTERLQALRAFANQAAAAIEATRHLADMRHLAEHDPLTGLRNRRGFEQRVENARRGAPWPCSSATSTTSSASTTPSTTRPATPCCAASPRSCAARCATTTPGRSSGARSSRSCSRAPTAPAAWPPPSACGAPCARCSPTSR